MCSVLRVVHVHVRDGVHVVHRVWLKHDVVVRKVVRNLIPLQEPSLHFAKALFAVCVEGRYIFLLLALQDFHT